MENSSGSAWLVFLVLFGLVGIFYPAVFGPFVSIGAFCLIWFVIYRLIGGT